MKRIIEIDKDIYEALAWMRKCDDLGTYYNSIAASKPFDDVLDAIRFEIEEMTTYDGTYIDRAYVFEIIDKYKESEDKK